MALCENHFKCKLQKKFEMSPTLAYKRGVRDEKFAQRHYCASSHGPAIVETPTTVPTAIPSPTMEKLQLEVLQIQAWTDPDGNVRANVLLRNPYDFPVKPQFTGRRHSQLQWIQDRAGARWAR